MSLLLDAGSDPGETDNTISCETHKTRIENVGGNSIQFGSGGVTAWSLANNSVRKHGSISFPEAEERQETNDDWSDRWCGGGGPGRGVLGREVGRVLEGCYVMRLLSTWAGAEGHKWREFLRGHRGSVPYGPFGHVISDAPLGDKGAQEEGVQGGEARGGWGVEGGWWWVRGEYKASAPPSDFVESVRKGGFHTLGLGFRV